jgi:hypothetical protein
MSHPLAIATVTAALEATLQDAGNQAVGEANVHIGRPDEKIAQNDKPTIGLYLYKVTPNQAIRNNRLPTRSTNGRLMETPAIPLDLHYLISFYGDDSKLEPERMLGWVVQVLDTKPILTRALIQQVIADHDPTLTASNLHQAVETVKATLQEMDLEAMSKLWSIFFQVPYALSLPYIFSYVLVEADNVGSPALPVTRRVVTTLPMSQARILAVEAEAGSSAPVVWNSKIRIRGRGLAKLGLQVTVNGEPADLTEADIRPEDILLPLTQVGLHGRELPAGLNTVQLVEPPTPGTPAHLERSSDLVSFPLRPMLSNSVVDNAAKNITVEFSPKVVTGQTVRLFLEELVGHDPKNYVLTPETIPGAGDPPVTNLVFPFSDVKPSTYLVQAQVDGIYSAPLVETDSTSPQFGQIMGLRVEIL